MSDIITKIPELYGELTPNEGKRWEVVYTKPKREKKIAEYALKHNINYYLPLVDSVKHYERKKMVYKKPMFSNYIFVNIDSDEKQKLIISGHTVCFLFVRDESYLLSELKQINQVRETGVEVVSHQYLEKGAIVQFKEGPLKGVLGMVVDSKNIEKVVLQVRMLKQAVAVTAGAYELEVLPDELEDED